RSIGQRRSRGSPVRSPRPRRESSALRRPRPLRLRRAPSRTTRRLRTEGAKTTNPQGETPDAIAPADLPRYPSFLQRFRARILLSLLGGTGCSRLKKMVQRKEVLAARQDEKEQKQRQAWKDVLVERVERFVEEMTERHDDENGSESEETVENAPADQEK